MVAQQDDLDLLGALWRARFLSASMIGRWLWPGRPEHKRRARLKRLTDVGWTGRYRPQLVPGQGTHEYVYFLTVKGFRFAQHAYGRDGRCIPADARFVDAPAVADHNGPAHDLHTAEWMLAYRAAAGERWLDWWGEDQSRIDIPTRYRDGRRTPIEVPDLKVPEPQRVDGIAEPLLPLAPDATCELYLPERDITLHVIVELDRTGRPSKNLDKLQRADALITAWWRAVPRFRALGAPPVAVFVSPGHRELHAMVDAADRAVVGHLATPGDAHAWPYPGRLRMRFAAEPDLIAGNPRALRLPDKPPEERTDAGLELRECILPGLTQSPPTTSHPPN